MRDEWVVKNNAMEWSYSLRASILRVLDLYLKPLKNISKGRNTSMVKRILRLLFLILLIILRKVSKKRSQLQYKLIEENTMGLIYEVGLASSVSPDVVYRLLNVTVDGMESVTQLDTSATKFVLDPVKEGASVTVALKDVDDAGNSSEWASVSFVAKDTLPPETPGAPTVTLVEEVADPAPVIVEGEAVVTPPQG
jgi:hypothetical protein